MKWQFDNGIKPGMPGFDYLNRNTGACYSENRHANDPQHRRGRLVQEYEATYGPWYPGLTNDGAPPLLGSVANGPNAEQLAAINCVKQGQNVFITGGAGMGKSFTLYLIIEELIKMYGADAVGVAASTGIAAIPINGTTVHRLAGLWIGNHPKTPSEKMVEHWCNMTCLIARSRSKLSTAPVHLPPPVRGEE